MILEIGTEKRCTFLGISKLYLLSLSEGQSVPLLNDFFFSLKLAPPKLIC